MYTAQILVGEAQPGTPGLVPGSLRQLLLAEDDGLAWRLFDCRVGATTAPVAIWIPERPETVLDDALLLIAHRVVEHEACCQLLAGALPGGGIGVDLRAEVPSDMVELARGICRRASFPRHKIVVVPFSGSSLMSQLRALAHYRIDCEVAFPRFVRNHQVYESCEPDAALLRAIWMETDPQACESPP